MALKEIFEMPIKHLKSNIHKIFQQQITLKYLFLRTCSSRLTFSIICSCVQIVKLITSSKKCNPILCMKTMYLVRHQHSNKSLFNESSYVYTLMNMNLIWTCSNNSWSNSISAWFYCIYVLHIYKCCIPNKNMGSTNSAIAIVSLEIIYHLKL